MKIVSDFAILSIFPRQSHAAPGGVATLGAYLKNGYKIAACVALSDVEVLYTLIKEIDT